MWEATKQAIRHLRSYEHTNRLLFEEAFGLDCGKANARLLSLLNFNKPRWSQGSYLRRDEAQLESDRRKHSTARHPDFYTS